MALANVAMNSNNVSFRATEDTSGVKDTFPGTTDCYEAAYVGAYSGGAIPFVVVNGQYVHALTSLVDPQKLANWSSPTYGAGGAGVVQNQVQSESGPAWNAIASQVYWIMAFLAKCSGAPVAYLAATYHWSSTVKGGVQLAYNQL
jgi:hypothetical protein